MRICSNPGLISMLMTIGCGLAIQAGCERDASETVNQIISDQARLRIEHAFKTNLAMNPGNTTTAAGVGEPLRQAPTNSQWGLENQSFPDISIQWNLDLVEDVRPVRIAIIDESFDVEAVHLKHAFDVDAGINLLQPGQPLWAAHRNGFHHGNLVASIIANRPSGSRSPLGVLGPSPVQLIPIVAAGGDGPSWRTPRATADMILQALRHALLQKADIINISAGMDVSREELEALDADPIWDELEETGIPVVCAAGNEGRNIDLEPLFPASIKRSNIMAVMGIGPDGYLAVRRDETSGRYLPASNWGAGTIDLAAPGEVIEVEARADQPQLVDGTSAAAAFATAVLAVEQDPRITPLDRLGKRAPGKGLIQFAAPAATGD